MERRFDLEELRRLARDLASRRERAYAEAQGEIEMMKASLRDRAAAIAERERDLAELEQRLTEHGLAAEIAKAQRLAAEAEAERPPARRPTASVRQKELDAREAALDEREAALEERLRAIGGDTMEMSFSDGLAALAQPDRN